MKYSKEHPKWSVMIPSYNCARFLEQTLQSVLQQDCREEMMQIEVVDDYSTKDDPETLVNRIGNGRVNFYRQAANVGAIKNFNTCVQRAKGEFVHILHGDDWVKDGIYEAVSKAFDKYPDIGIVITGCSDFDENSRLLKSPIQITSLLCPSSKIDNFLYSNPIRPPGVVIKKSVYETIGNFDQSLIHCADWDMWVRAIHNFGGLFIPNDLASYRIFPGNDTSKLTLSGENLRDYQRLFLKFKKTGYPIDEKQISTVLKNTFLAQYRNIRVLNFKKSISLYKKEMHRYLTATEIADLKKESTVLTLKSFVLKMKQLLKRSVAFVKNRVVKTR
jgi:glycosyltransferase involved in cell wall biosynthesis